MAKKVLISGYYGFGNFGDEAILSVLASKLKHMDFDVTVLSSTPKLTAMDYFVNTLYSFDLLRVINALKTTDVLLSGGGSLLQDVTSVKSLFYYLAVIFLALFFKVKVIIFAQGIGPINNKIARLITRLVLKKCDYVSVRDSSSKDLLDSWGIRAELLCDPIFSLDCKSISKNNVVGVQLRNFSTLTEDFLCKLAFEVANNFGDKKIEILSLQDSIDLDVCWHFDKILKSVNPEIVTEVINGLSIDEFIGRISKMEYLVAMRFHALVVALKAGVKSLAINYDVKVEKLAHEAHIPLIPLIGDDSLENEFKQLKALDSNLIQEYASSKLFDWGGIEKALKD